MRKATAYMKLMLACPKNHQKSVARPILACPLLQKDDLWSVPCFKRRPLYEIETINKNIRTF